MQFLIANLATFILSALLFLVIFVASEPYGTKLGTVLFGSRYSLPIVPLTAVLLLLVGMADVYIGVKSNGAYGVCMGIMAAYLGCYLWDRRARRRAAAMEFMTTGHADRLKQYTQDC